MIPTILQRNLQDLADASDWRRLRTRNSRLLIGWQPCAKNLQICSNQGGHLINFSPHSAHHHEITLTFMMTASGLTDIVPGGEGLAVCLEKDGEKVVCFVFMRWFKGMLTCIAQATLNLVSFEKDKTSVFKVKSVYHQGRQAQVLHPRLKTRLIV